MRAVLLRRLARVADLDERRSVLRIATLLAAALVSACATINPSSSAIQGTEHWVQSVSAHDKKPLKLYVWEKHRADLDLKALSGSGKVVVLAHGATTPGRVCFDLQVDGVKGSTHSLMDYLAARGYDVFTLDYQNYGRSQGHPCGTCVTTQVAADDLNAVVDYVRSQRSVKQVYLLGWSWGTTVASLFDMKHSGKVRRLVLYAPPVWHGPRFQVPPGEFRPVTEGRSRGLFTPGEADPATINAFVAAATKFTQAPNGVLVDLLTRMPLTDPSKITAPTLVIFGEKDKLTPITQLELPGFFSGLANNDKQLSIIPGGGHGLMLEKPRERLQFEVLKWFSVDQPGWGSGLSVLKQ